jgi:anti-sigma B factor antagonist
VEANLEAVGDVVVVEVLTESIDVTNADGVRARLGEMADAHRKAVVDLHRVKFLDSAGCGALAASLTHFRTRGGDLRLCSPTRNVKTLLELVRLNRLLALYDTRDAAVASFAAKG